MAPPHLNGHLSDIIVSTDHFSGTTDGLYCLCDIRDKFMASPYQMDYLYGTIDILWHLLA